MYNILIVDQNKSEDMCLQVARNVGATLGKLHDSEIVHGDLTTSNIMIRHIEDNKIDIVMIDFGLGNFMMN